MKRLKALALIVIILLTVPGCKTGENPVEKNPGGEDDRIQIAMSFDSFVIERWQRDRDVFVSTAKELGATVNVQNANGDVEKQKEQIEYFIKKGVDVIVIVCIDSDSLKDTVQKAKDEGIKIIAYDRLVTNSNADLYITFDNEMVGTMMAEALAANGAAGGKVLMLEGSPLDNNVPAVEKGFMEVCKAANTEVADSIFCDGWRAEIAADYIYEHEDIVKSVDGIMCGNDNLAGQVIRALSEKRLAGEIPIVGQDADLEACQRIVEGTQTMTVYKPVEKLAKRAAECAIALAKGESFYAEDVSTINDGTYDIRYIGLTPIAVTIENLDEVIIGSGFHLKEDVYLNVPEASEEDTEDDGTENGPEE
ncbi:MAG: substrate-binding domain-containing protein [Lachnospiraceae bacterium]|nr:substrate-binding domain-containing protein [Lachnospiraceae bacterium]